MANIKTHTYCAWFYVEITGRDSSMLEAALLDAERRNGKSHTFYSDTLWTMLRADGISVPAISHYGHLMFRVDAPSLDELQRALRRADHVTEQWIKRYRIKGMLPA